MPLTENLKQFLYICLILIFIFLGNLSYKYLKFYVFIDGGEQDIIAKIERDYLKTKNNRTYRIALLDVKDYKFYTKIPKTSNVSLNDIVKITIYNIDINFYDYLKGKFYMPSSNIVKIKKDKNIRDDLIDSVQKQHQNSKISELFNALYFSSYISSGLRSDIVNFGISHLVAISGYHLGLIVSIFYLILTPFLKYIYLRFIPFRDYKFDIFIISFLFLTFYIYIIDYPPSFLRAFVMFLVGFYFVVRNIQVLNFTNLFIAIFICLSIFPNLIFSFGFYFSCMGVLYIFIYLKYFDIKKHIFLKVLFLNLYMFFAMQVPVLYFFPNISLDQIISIPLSYIFIVFYPLSVLLHIFGAGGLFDSYLIDIFSGDYNFLYSDISFVEFIIFNAISLIAIRIKQVAILLPLVGLLVFLKFCLF
ncbi:competence protein, ComEC family [Campylobacter pinnipediorum subsp. caledonicus]|uniref:Competence protein, ComEC family n=1 Tax=Campylobacter pinnipediorum subsp. caledonicus TaxID=1874362 RepID=A0A1S6U829_9BACT|nr:ComEC/Rec2 family competence protein [Campylobacter pinnipediorum]AQW87607.1 competence protein, ComEC family [Campylobacter pinnipediorum subsp. caledonicus]